MSHNGSITRTTHYYGDPSCALLCDFVILHFSYTLDLYFIPFLFPIPIPYTPFLQLQNMTKQD